MHGPVEPKPADVPEDQASVSSEAKTHLKLSSSDEVPCPPSSEATPRSCSDPPAPVASSSSVDMPGEAVGMAPASSSTVTETSPESGQEEEEAEAVGDYSTTSSEAALSPGLMSEYDAWLLKAGYSRERSVEAQTELNRLLKCVVASSLLRSKEDCQSLLLRRGREVEELLALFRSGPQRAFYDQFRDWLGMGTSAATTITASSQPPPQGFMPPAAAAATAAVQQQPPSQHRPDAAPSPPPLAGGRHGLSAPSTLLSLAQGEAGFAASGQSGAGLSGSTSSSSFSSSGAGGGALPSSSSSSSSACPSIASLPLPNSGPLPSAPLEPRRTGARRGRPPGSAAVNFLAPDLKNDYQEWLVAKKGLTQLSSTQYCNSIGLVIKDLYEPGRVRREKLAVPFDVPAVRAMLTQRFDEIETLLNNSVKRNAVKYLMEYLDLKLPRPMVPIKTHKPAASRDLKLPPGMGLLPPRGIIPPGLASGTLIQPGRPATVQHAAQHHLFSHPPRGMPPMDAIMGGPSLFFPGARPPATSLSVALQQQQQQQVMSQSSAFRPSAALPRFDQTGLPPASAADHLALQQLAQQHQHQLAAQQQQQLLQSAFNARAAMGVGGDARLFGDGNRGSTGGGSSKASRSAEDDQLALLHHVAKLQRMHSGGGQQQQEQQQQQQPPQWPLGSRVDPALEGVGGHMTSLASAMHQQQQQQQASVMNRGGGPNALAQSSTSRLASMMEAQQAAAFQQQQQQRAPAMALQGSSANPQQQQQQQQPDWARRGAAGPQQVAPEFRNHLDRLTQERLEYQSRLQQLERQNLNMASELTAAKRECHVLNQRLLTSDQLQANVQQQQQHQHQHLSPALAPMSGIDGRVAEAQEAMMRRGLDASSSSSSIWSRAFQQQAVEEEGRRREQLLGSIHQQQQQQEVAAAGMLTSALLHAAAVAASSATQQQQQQQQQQQGASAMPPSSSVADPSGGKSIFGGSNSTYSLAGAGSSSDNNIASDANLLQSLRRGGSGNLSALGPAGVLTATRASGPGPTGSQLASLLALSSSQRSVGSNGSGTGGSTGGGSVLPSWQV